MTSMISQYKKCIKPVLKANKHYGAALALISAATLMPAANAYAQAADYPNAPVRLVVPFPPGGAADIIARTISKDLSSALGQQVVVDNRTGAGGIVGAGHVALAKPDGYTLILTTGSTQTIKPAIDPASINYRPTDFAPVIKLGTSPAVLVVQEASDIESAATLAQRIKSEPNKLTFGSSGINTTPHLLAELFLFQAGGLKATHIPYRGTAMVIPDIVEGRVDFMLDNIISVQPSLRKDGLKALAVASDKRLSLLPEVPTFAEAGTDGVNIPAWFGILAPANTPGTVIEKLNNDLNAILKKPETVKAFAGLGIEAVGGSADQFQEQINTEISQWQKLSKAMSDR